MKQESEKKTTVHMHGRLTTSPLAKVRCIQEGCVPSCCCLLVSCVIHNGRMHPTLAYNIHNKHTRGGFTICQLDWSCRVSRHIALACQPIHKIPHSLLTAVSLLLLVDSVSTTFLASDARSRLASTNTKLLLFPKIL